MRRLNDCGWKNGQRPVSHTARSPKLYGDSGFVSRKPYLQCLLVLDSLLERGLAALSSSETMSYYRLVMFSAHPAQIPLGQRSGHYDAELRKLEDLPRPMQLDPIAPRDSEEESDEPIGSNMPRKGIVSQRPALDSGAGVALVPRAVASAASGSVPAGPAVSGGQASPSKSPRLSYSPSSDSDPVISGPGTPEFLPPVLPNVRVEVHGQPGQRKYYRRLIIACPLGRCQHSGTTACMKHRNFGRRQVGLLGPREPEGFLGAWAAHASQFESRAAHVRWSPSVRQVRAFMVGQGWLAS